MLKQFLLDKIIIKKNQNFEDYDGKNRISHQFLNGVFCLHV